jgi:hypothetical protein
MIHEGVLLSEKSIWFFITYLTVNLPPSDFEPDCSKNELFLWTSVRFDQNFSFSLFFVKVNILLCVCLIKICTISDCITTIICLLYHLYTINLQRLMDMNIKFHWCDIHCCITIFYAWIFELVGLFNYFKKLFCNVVCRYEINNQEWEVHRIEPC